MMRVALTNQAGFHSYLGNDGWSEQKFHGKGMVHVFIIPTETFSTING